MRPGFMELVVILVIVLLIFGPGRLGKVAGELGVGIKNFRKGMKDGEDEADAEVKDQSEIKED